MSLKSRRSAKPAHNTPAPETKPTASHSFEVPGEHPEFTHRKRSSILNSFSGLQTSPDFPFFSPPDLQTDIQAVKAHLYNRRFDLAFAEPRFQRAYAIRWSPTRALAYRELLKCELERYFRVSLPPLPLLDRQSTTSSQETRPVESSDETARPAETSKDLTYPSTTPPVKATPLPRRHKIVCLGAGAGAEVAAFFELFEDRQSFFGETEEVSFKTTRPPLPELHIVDSAPWGRVLKSLAHTPPNTTYNCPLTCNVCSCMTGEEQNPPIKDDPEGSAASELTVPLEHLTINEHSNTREHNDTSDTMSTVVHMPKRPLYLEPHQSIDEARWPADLHFTQADVLDLPGHSFLRDIIKDAGLVTLCFTLNELYTASRARTTTILFTMTDILPRGAFLLVVDSSSDYATVDVGKDVRDDQQKQTDGRRKEKMYPMHWLLDHTLLHAASGRDSKGRAHAIPRWEKVYEDKSRWYRVPPGLTYPIELENMRYQVHMYWRI